jgi:hypothetical protein
MTTIEGMCNQALDLVGYTRHIGNIYEGTKAARIALDIWSETRDALLQTMRPDWARQDIRLTLNKSAPAIVNGMADYTGVTWTDGAHPALPWLYEYAYPTNCIEPLQIKGEIRFLPRWRPRANTFRVRSLGGSMVILSNQAAAILVCVAKVTDPNLWHEEFIEAMIQILARKFEAELAPQRRAARQQQEQQQQNANNSG